jgi:hypothetical protein
MAESKKTTRKLLLNSGRSGVVYNEAGNTLGGGEHLVFDDLEDGKLDSVGSAAVEAGYLRVVTVGN